MSDKSSPVAPVQNVVHTPKTDACVVRSRCGVFVGNGEVDHEVVTANFARTLERETAILKDAMREIACLQYQNAAVNFAAYKATVIAKQALGKVE
jgi:hypothetical protein